MAVRKCSGTPSFKIWFPCTFDVVLDLTITSRIQYVVYFAYRKSISNVKLLLRQRLRITCGNKDGISIK